MPENSIGRLDNTGAVQPLTTEPGKGKTKTPLQQSTDETAGGALREAGLRSSQGLDMPIGTPSPVRTKKVQDASEAVLVQPKKIEKKNPHEELKRIKECVGECLKETDHINTEAVGVFAETLKVSAETFKGEEVININGRQLQGKKAEQEFVVSVMKNIVKQTKAETKRIAADPSLTVEEKSLKLKNLALASQSLLALASVQHRFGGRLAFHCLPHSLGVATGAAEFYKDTRHEFAAFCAGANHDTVMYYQAPPLRAKSDVAGKAFLQKFIIDMHEKEDELYTKGDPKPLHAFIGSDIRLMKWIKKESEQKRVPGFKDGNSEKESYKQLQSQLNELEKVMDSAIHESGGKDGAAIAAELKSQINETYPFMEKSIQGTIPLLHGFALPGMGVKFMSIFNDNVMPTPVELEASGSERMIKVLDKVSERVNPGGPTYSQAVKDIRDVKAFYLSLRAEVAEFEKTKGGRITDGEFAPLRDKHKKEYTGELPRAVLPVSLETKDTINFLPNLFPTYDDPAKKWTKSAEEIAQIFKEELIKDAEENGDQVIEELIKRASTVGTAATDLGAMMSATASAQEESVALIVEEQDYDARQFLAFQKKFTTPGTEIAKAFPEGLKDPRLHLALGDEYSRKKYNISDEDYADIIRFLSLAYFFNHDQKPFSEGRRGITQHYIYQPMLAVAEAVKDRKVNADVETLATTLKNFEAAYVVEKDGAKVLRDNYEQLDKLAKDSEDPAVLSTILLDELEKRFGNFVDAGFTAGDHVDERFIQEQSSPLIDSRIWV